MHILFLTDNFPPEGNAIASRVYERACYWVKWGHDVTIITSVPNFPEGKVYAGYKNKFYQVEMISGIKVVRVKTFIAKNQGLTLRILDFLSYILPALLAGLWQKKPDVIVATSPQIFVGLTACCLSFMKRKPFILEVADIWPASIVGVGAMKKNLIIKYLEKLELFLYRNANAIVVLTNAFRDNLINKKINADKISVVLNGVELTQYSPTGKNLPLKTSLNIPDNALVYGYLGTHGMAHALKNILNAAKILQQDKEIFFLFVGAGAERDELIQYAQQKKLDNILFLPAQTKNKMPAFWSICDVALIHLKNNPVFAEVIPSKIFEAMGMGLPILLAAPMGEASKIILQQKVGICVPAEEPDKLALAIIEMKDQQLRHIFQKNSLRAAPIYSREKQARAMLDIFLKEFFALSNLKNRTDS